MKKKKNDYFQTPRYLFYIVLTEQDLNTNQGLNINYEGLKSLFVDILIRQLLINWNQLRLKKIYNIYLKITFNNKFLILIHKFPIFLCT